MKTVIVTLLSFYLPLVCYGQHGENSYRSYQEEADRIVIRFLGQEVFDRYVGLDSAKSYYWTNQNGVSRATTFEDLPQFTPVEFVFCYTFYHPGLSGERFLIRFTLDSAAQFLVNDQTHGLIQTKGFDEATVISKKQALTMCRAGSHIVKKSSLKLAWNDDTVDYDRFRNTHNLAHLWTGRIVWQAKARVKFRGIFYDGTIAVDVLTGQVTRAFPELPWD